jgi:cytochrome c oxidase subunit IV
MSMHTQTDGHPAPVGEHGVGQHDHPSDLQYVKIAIILAVLTAIEVATYFFEEDISTLWLLAILFPLMVAKFWIVASFFMHLKFDTPLFTRMFVAGITFAVAVYIVMLLMFQYWG